MINLHSPLASEPMPASMTVLSNPDASKNSVPPVLRLPTETLESIFTQGARDYYYQDNNGLLFRTAPSWVHVSYVCRRWRSVSLNCPLLWTYLFETSPRWTEELLFRSKRAPLKLSVDMNFWDGTHPGSPFFEQVVTHVERLQEFCIRLPFRVSTRHQQFFSMLSSPAPRLRNLTILPSYLPSWSNWPSSVPFSGDTPALRTLKVTRCALPWHLLKLGGLTTLDFSIPSWPHQKSIDDFLSTLRCMQDLTHLYLEHAVAGANDFHSTAVLNVQKINLPYLSCLFISAPLSTLIAFLSYVNFPSKTEVRLGCAPQFNSTLDDYLHLSSLFTQKFQSFDCPVIRSLTTRFVWNKATLTFSASELACDSSVFAPRMDWLHNVPMQLCVDFERSMPKRSQDDIVSDICCKMPLTAVQSAHIITPPFSSSFWGEMLGHLPEIRYLKLSQGLMPDLAPVLSPILGEDMEGGGPLATALDKLELHDITFSSLLDLEKLDIPPAADVDSLYGALSARKGSGGKMIMSQCVIGQYHNTEQLDVAGRWGDGQFLVIEEHRRPRDSVFESEESDSDSLFGSLDEEMAELTRLQDAVGVGEESV